MTSQTHEKAFEDELCAHLAANGWLYSQSDAGYDRHRALFPEDVFAWLSETQPEELAKKVKPSMSAEGQAKARDGILTRLASLLDKGQPVGGSLQVLRGGFKDTPSSFAMMQRGPETSVNPSLALRYAANRLRVMRQVHYSTKHNNSIDLVFFVNGIPVATAELKTSFTQSVGDAKQQYRHDRTPAGEPLLGFGTRALVHFAVSNDEVWMTTKLAGTDTVFLPFNRGSGGHQGNGADEDGGSPTTYLWRDVLHRDQWLDILGKFIHYETEKKTDPDTGKPQVKHTLIFPRFHQLDAVTKVLADVRAHGVGQRYLIQHSAGSGKTRSIAWTAHRLATLHDDQNVKVFDTVIVVTDRNVLDAQLQEAVKQIESKDGVVATISSKEACKHSFSSKSGYLTSALTSGKLIVVVTIQTFPFVLRAIQENSSLSGRRFAVIADEAHSSQTGETASKLKQVLSDQEWADLNDGGEVDVEAILAAEAKAKADTHNISFLAFTATPKAKTMELFGTTDADGLPRPFHVYTMAQAIEERFIVDVLQSYTSYKTAYELAVKLQNQPTVQVVDSNGLLVDESAAMKGLMRWVKLHPTNIAQKVQVIVEHFEANVKPLLGGQAKAMVVTDSRKAAVRYKLAMDAYIKKMGYDDATSLVAFSGEVEDLESGPGKFTESSMNPSAHDLRTAFDTDAYRVMIVANKFQTGFDQPKLCAMYVDRQLSGVATVQTLSRLNRYLPGKQTMVLDFVNNPDDIVADFKPYYEDARIEATTDPNLIHDLGTKLDTAGMYTADEVVAVVDAVVRKLGNNKISGAMQPVKHRFVTAYNAAVMAGDKATQDELELFRKDVGTYVRLHDFLSQIINFDDTEVEKRAVFCRILQGDLRGSDGDPEIIDLGAVNLVHIKQKDLGTQQLALHEGEVMPSGPTGAGSKVSRDPKLVLLGELVERLNEQFAGEDFRDDQLRSWSTGLVEAMKTDDDLRTQAEVNSQDQFLASPTLRDALLLAVAENNQAHGRMTQLFNEKGGVEQAMLGLLGRLLYLELHDSQVLSTDLPFPGTVGAVLDTQQSPHETAAR